MDILKEVFSPNKGTVNLINEGKFFYYRKKHRLTSRSQGHKVMTSEESGRWQIKKKGREVRKHLMESLPRCAME